MSHGMLHPNVCDQVVSILRSSATFIAHPWDASSECVCDQVVSILRSSAMFIAHPWDASSECV